MPNRTSIHDRPGEADGRLLFPYRHTPHTITTDNGCEFAVHEEMTRKLSIKGSNTVKVYLADPYSSWQKEDVENANKLIRKCIPKNANFNNFTDRKIMNVQKKLNGRPREKLNFHSPMQYFFKNV